MRARQGANILVVTEQTKIPGFRWGILVSHPFHKQLSNCFQGGKEEVNNSVALNATHFLVVVIRTR